VRSGGAVGVYRDLLRLVPGDVEAWNALKHRMVDFDAAEHSAWVDRVLAKYDEEFFRVHSGAEYERLMGHWKNVIPIEILDVQYEQLLDDLEGESRRMLDYCELDWQSVCLEFHRNKRPVRTASSWQVRQPLYRTAKARWRKFEPHLDGLKKALSNRAVRWDSAG
jgi:Sulfotransferase family